MLILGIPYALTIGVLIAFTALIPTVGCNYRLCNWCNLILPTSPIKAVVFVIFLLIFATNRG